MFAVAVGGGKNGGGLLSSCSRWRAGSGLARWGRGSWWNEEEEEVVVVLMVLMVGFCVLRVGGSLVVGAWCFLRFSFLWVVVSQCHEFWILVRG